jgi:hypothetical protein
LNLVSDARFKIQDAENVIPIHQCRAGLPNPSGIQDAKCVLAQRG